MSGPRDVSAGARRSSGERLDAAIDRVAARIVHVRDDEALASRIARALPELSSRFSRLLPQFAAVAALATAAVVWTMRDTTTLLPSNLAAMMAVPNTALAVTPGTTSRAASKTKPVEPLERLEHMEPVDGDFERSLAPIESMTALVISSVTPDELPATSPLELVPMTIIELPLTADTFSPR